VSFVSQTVRRLTAVAALSFVPALAVAQAPATEALPSADEIVAKHVAATGGEAAIRKHSSTRATGTFELAAAGLSGTVSVISAAPNRTMLRIEVPGMGEILQGFDGTNAWSVNPMAGARLAEGPELQMQVEEAGYYGVLDQKESVTRKATGRAEMGGVPCYQVTVTFKSGREATECYGVESGLLVARQGRVETPQGVIEQTVLIGDYKDFGGIKAPTTMRLQVAGVEQVIRLTSVEYDTVKPEEFTPPAAIQTLIKGKAPGTR
jgi:hypothetical protein